MTKPLTVLLVEDDDIDTRLTRRAFRKLPNVTLVRVSSGEAALEAVTKDPKRWNLVLLDLHLGAGMDGHDVLRTLKGNAQTCGLPIVALTSSRSEDEILQSWNLQVAGYLRKPVEAEPFEALATILVKWWTVNELRT